MTDKPKWNFEEFTTYLLLFASSADMEITEEEENLIRKRISDQQYNTIKSEFEQAGEYERIQTILSYKGLYFPTEVHARELMDLIVKLFKVDGNFSTLEENSLRLLKRLI